MTNKARVTVGCVVPQPTVTETLRRYDALVAHYYQIESANPGWRSNFIPAKDEWELQSTGVYKLKPNGAGPWQLAKLAAFDVLANEFNSLLGYTLDNFSDYDFTPDDVKEAFNCAHKHDFNVNSIVGLSFGIIPVLRLEHRHASGWFAWRARS